MQKHNCSKCTRMGFYRKRVLSYIYADTMGSKSWVHPSQQQRVIVPSPPQTLTVFKFAESHAAELESLHSIVANRLSNDYRSKRNKRRRTTSFDNRSKKNQHRKKHNGGNRNKKNKEMVGDAAETKNLPRRIRRRIDLKKNPATGFCTSGDGTKRLRTHVWHAKRFKMTKLWGFYLPLGLLGGGRGSRAVLKWYRNGAVVHDSSYYIPIQLEGPEDSLLSILSMVLEPAPPAHYDAHSGCFLCGRMYKSAMLHYPVAPASQAICPATYMWRPLNQHGKNLGIEHGQIDGEHGTSSHPRQLWIWIHPSAFTEGFEALKCACQKEMCETGVLVNCLSLEGQLARLEVLGSRAFQVLQKVIDPISCFSDEGDDIHKDNRKHILANEDSYIHSAVQCLNALHPLSLSDERIEAAKTPNVDRIMVDAVGDENRVENSGAAGDDKTRESCSSLQLTSKTNDVINCTDLWDACKGLPLPVEENTLCMERHQRRLDFFSLKDTNLRTIDTPIEVHGSRVCPIMLLRNANQAGSLRGWSIILPVSWVKSFWSSLVSSGVHALGLRERRWIACEVGLPCFPSDFPDCDSYTRYKTIEAAAEVEKLERRPPAVRPFNIPIALPWNSLYFTLDKWPVQVKNHENPLADSDGGIIDVPPAICNSPSHEVFVARTFQALSCLMDILGCSGNNFSELMKDVVRVTQDSNGNSVVNPERKLCFLRVLLRAHKEGVFEEGAVISAPHLSDISSFASRSSYDDEVALQLPVSLVSSYFKDRGSNKWEFQLPNNPVAIESYRRPIGFVTTGFVRGSKKPTAVGFCEAVLLARLKYEQLSKMKRSRKEVYVLVRNLRSTAYRLALATIVLEELGEDVESL